jgi:hypothetical protein
MRRSGSPFVLQGALLLGGALLLALGVGCATYRADLDRARAHYEKNEYEPALALFRVLENDMDSFSAAEQTQYAYSRGMTDYRLAALANQGNGVADPKGSFRANSRHWLAVARAVEKETPGGLTGDEKQRLDDALVDLNKDVYGGGDSATPAPTAAVASSATPSAGAPPAKANPAKGGSK